MSFAFFFPGQGSQSLNMMAGFDNVPAVRAAFDEASAALCQDLWAMMNGSDAELIGQTVNTQPLMLAAGIATWRAYLEAGGKAPAAVAGHSLGEYSALVVAGSLKFADAVKLVRLRAELMQSAVPQGEGAMAAVLGLDDDTVRRICAEAAQGGVVEAVNFNSPGQVVIAGETAAVGRAMEAAKAAGAKRALKLKVGGAFHSPLMEPARAELAEAIESTTFNRPVCPVYQNVDARPQTDPDAIRRNLVAQLTSPVRWTQTVRHMTADGATHFTELGPGNVLQGLIKKIESAVATDGLQ